MLRSPLAMEEGMSIGSKTAVFAVTIVLGLAIGADEQQARREKSAPQIMWVLLQYMEGVYVL